LKSKISLVKSKSHYEGVKSSLTPFREDLKNKISNLSSIVIKINLVITRTPAYNKGVELATTPFDAVRSFIDFILPFYKERIIIAEEAAWGDTKEGFKMYGFSKLIKENSNVELLNLEEDETINKRVKYPGDELELPFSKTLMEAPFLVSITRPKTHCSVVMTAGIKNVLVGAIHKYSMRNKIHKGRFIHFIISSISGLAYPDFVITDGTVGMESGGPVRGKEINSGWALSSFDALTADSLAAYLMGFDINDIGYLILLKEKGIGLSYPNNKIEIIGEKPKDLVFPFKPHRSFKKTRIWK
jgi:uncharacterized protein (DUF362 family)